jgi:hypothetical protein
LKSRSHSFRDRAALLLLAIIALAVTPDCAWAWTPGTHIYLGEAVLRSLQLLPTAVAEILHAFPYDFLYGSIAADSSMAKKYAPAGRHCHAWHVGLEILERAGDEPMRSFAMGYLAHLAADSVAHNYFVPRQLAITSSTASLGHSYWESRFESHIGERAGRTARQIIQLDHSRADSLLDKVLSPTIFSTRTNRRIFRGMVYVSDADSWQRIFQVMSENSRWDLPDSEVARFMAASFDYVVDFLRRSEASLPYKLDPAGEAALRSAKKVRRAAIRRGGTDEVADKAEAHFGLPARELAFWREIEQPLYPPALSESS